MGFIKDIFITLEFMMDQVIEFRNYLTSLRSAFWPTQYQSLLRSVEYAPVPYHVKYQSCSPPIESVER